MVIERLRPHPHRGALIAAGAVPLALAAALIDLRMIQWPIGVRFGVVGLVAWFLVVLAWLAELERESPRPYHSVLLITGLLALVLALVLLAEVLGANRPPGAGGLGWIFALEAAAAAVAARHANSAACTLIAALAAGVAAEALVIWIFSPHGLGTARAILLTLTIIYAGMAVRLRDRRRRHAVAFVNAAGLATLTVGATYLVGLIGENPGGAPFGWKAFLVLIGTGLVAYAAIDREPGPGYLGLAVLGTFVVLAGAPVVARGSLVGWPLFLLIIGGAGIGVGLRPRRPLPPSPDANISGAAPTVPLHQQKQP